MQSAKIKLSDARITVEYNCRRCSRCILPETFPEITFKEDGVCNYCEEAKAEEKWSSDNIVSTVTELVSDSDPSRQYDCLALYSGGKDSSMALLTVVRDLGLRTLAFTLDNGFVSPIAVENIANFTSGLGVDHIMYRPSKSVMTQIYSISLTEPFNIETTKYSTSSCGSCISVVLSSAARLALEKKIPLLVGGWTPGQLTNQPLLDGDFLKQICSNHFGSLSQRSTTLRAELNRFQHSIPFPKLFNPLYLDFYHDDEILRILRDIGWQLPTDTDSCSTNCRLNSLLVVDHILKYGYHPYEFELAAHVRQGFTPRAAALSKISQINVSKPLLDTLAKELGYDLGVDKLSDDHE